MFESLWTPYWYGLDQPLKIGQVDDFDFFAKSPEYVAVGDTPVLYHGLPHDGEGIVERCRVERIVHAQLGELKELSIRGLDYVFVLSSGDEIEVNAEEEPGIAYDCPLAIGDWSLTVHFEPVPELPSPGCDGETDSTQERQVTLMTSSVFMRELGSLVAVNRNDEAFSFLKANFADVYRDITVEERMLIADWMEGAAMALDCESDKSDAPSTASDWPTRGILIATGMWETWTSSRYRPGLRGSLRTCRQSSTGTV